MLDERTSAAPVLEVRDLTTRFTTNDGELPAVESLSLRLERGRVLGLVGESGSGKSVTGYSIMGLIDRPGRIVSGEVLLDGYDLVGLPERELRSLRGRRLAMIFQDPMMTLNPVLRIDFQMIEAVRAHARVSHRKARSRALEALEMTGIADPLRRLSNYPHQLSGGMRQRVAIAIALLHRPDVLIADEPTTALDVTIQSQILAEVQRLAAEFGTAVIWITHDLSVVSGLADELAVMYAGRIVEQGPVGDVIGAPRHPYTDGLIKSLPSNNPRGVPLAQIPGMTPNMFELPQGCSFMARCHRANQTCRRIPALTPSSTALHHLARCVHPLDSQLDAQALR
ncbi:ABC transporter ATP-binding protein [Halotalea alkalilenta]|uniref:ABC-type dipeptide transporter n=1 Tax=Halotalea alkalilenta TaxID=376489 RepID=A0A172YBN6_9GAMM|nr:ABC transporter ATP-binding protein [Halotalea alkalilenta]ANF56659.1 methionine ABC transporter ATP-binding protein [Halotalea alkalilenta]